MRNNRTDSCILYGDLLPGHIRKGKSIGLNPQAKIVGNMLCDEKVYRTCHIAIGANYDDDAKALIHLDGLIKNPTITAWTGNRKRVLMKDGELMLGGK